MATHTAVPPVMHSVIITATQSSIDNGRLYFPKGECKGFFPEDSIGGRAAGSAAPDHTHLTFDAGGVLLVGDVRDVGASWSPRRSFARFLRQIRAVEGTRLRVTRHGECEYRIDVSS